MENDENSNQTPEVYDFSHNSNSWPSEEMSEGSITSYLQFQRPETPPEYRDEDVKENPSIEIVSFISNDQNPSKSEVEVPEPLIELPSNSPGVMGCYQQGDEMDTQQSSIDSDTDLQQPSEINIPDSQQSTAENTTETPSAQNTTELTDSSQEKATQSQDTSEECTNQLQDSPTGELMVELSSPNRRNTDELPKEENATELQDSGDANTPQLQDLYGEIPTELQHPSEDSTLSLQSLREDRTSDLDYLSGLPKILNPNEGDISPLENKNDENATQLSKRELQPQSKDIIIGSEHSGKENISKLTQSSEVITEIQIPGEKDISETQYQMKDKTNLLEYPSGDKTTEFQLSIKESMPNLEQSGEDSTSELAHPREENITNETLDPKDGSVQNSRDESEVQYVTGGSISELESISQDKVIEFQHPKEEKTTEFDSPSREKLIESQYPEIENLNELEPQSEDKIPDPQLPLNLGDKVDAETQEDIILESQSASDNIKIESEVSREEEKMETQQENSEDNSLPNQTEDDGAKEPTETQVVQPDELEDTQLVRSEMEHGTNELTDKTLDKGETEATPDSGKLVTSSGKPEPEANILVDDSKGEEEQSNASTAKPETKPDQLVISAPVITPSVVMQEHMSNEEYRSWKEVLETPEDFEAWVKLLALAEKHENSIVIRETFDRFLKLYPYCYGYWRKFADLVLRLQGWPHAQQILEIGVYSIPLSIDLWLHYAGLSFNQGIDYTALTALYDRSLEIAGYEYRSDLLWEAAIHYHESQNQMVKVFTLLRQLIATPTQNYKKHFHKYETFLNTLPIRELLSVEEFKSIGEQTKYTRLANDSAKSLEDKVKDCLLDQGRQVHAATEEEIGLRQPFEEKIKRPYFHVQPLEETQLQTWRSYLDFEIARKYKDRIVFLFERCMIVCALYEQMWIKYAKFLGTEYSEEARAVFQRGACYIPKSVAIHLEWSLFEESLGQLDRARELLQTIDQKIPELIDVRSRYISFELRHGDKDKVDELYKQSVSQAQKQFQKNAAHSDENRLLHDVYNCWVAKYVFFLHRHRNEHAVAKKMLFDAIEKDKDNSTLYFHLVDLELNQQSLDKDKVMSVLNKAIHAPIAQEAKEMFSLRKLHWAEVMGIPLDYRVMNELKALRDKSIASPSPSSTHALRKRPNEYESDLYAKQSRMDPGMYATDQHHHQHNASYQQSGDPNQQGYPPYYQASSSGYQYQGQGGEPNNQQWSQQYNYQQDWGYQQQQQQYQH